MGRILFKYILSFSIILLFGIILLDYIILPNYVGYNNEHYLPDVRGEYLEKATYQLGLLGFDTELFYVPYSESHSPGSVIKMFPRAFTKVKKGRDLKVTVIADKEDIIVSNFICYFVNPF